MYSTTLMNESYNGRNKCDLYIFIWYDNLVMAKPLKSKLFFRDYH